MKLWRMRFPTYSYNGGVWVWILAPDQESALRIYSSQVLGENYDWDQDDAWEHLQDMFYVEYPLDQPGVLPPIWQDEPIFFLHPSIHPVN